MKIIAISNQKGGVGKTTTSHSIIVGLAKRGYKVLGIDIDPQANLSSVCGAENYNTPTVYELMKCDAKSDEVVQTIKNSDLEYDFISSNIMLAGIEHELSSTGREYRLKEVIEPISSKYDFIIIDTPPSLGILTVNAFTFATDIIIPTTAGIFAATGINQLNETIKNVKKYCNPDIKINGILFTRFNPRTNISKQIKELTEKLSEYISVPIYNTYIRNSVVIEEAQANKNDIFQYSKSTVSEDYNNFIDEFLLTFK